MFVDENGPAVTARHPPGSDRVAAGFRCFAGPVVAAPVSPSGRLQQALCSWQARWISVMAAVLALNTWTAGNVGAPSRGLIVMLVLLTVLALTTGPGWRLLRTGLTAEHLSGTVGGLAGAAFLLLGLQVVLSGPLSGADVAVSRFAAGLPHGGLYGAAQLVSAIGQFGVQAGGLLVLAAVLAWRRRRWRPLLVAAVAVTMVGVTVGAGKLLLGREGPSATVHALHVGGSSLPSGHTTAAVVLGGVAAWLIGHGARWLLRRLWQGAAAVWGVLIGLDPLYLNVHWLTDVLAGWALGAACSAS